ncbi:hypothetical protein Areg01_05550 [Actinoplanes regularis]|nr:hypothetical protein Areg01_05550 [Actinoplanes regularis]
MLPRGWVHNPHALDQTEDSVHLTFVIRERTGFWIGEKLAKAAIESTSLRRVMAPADIVGEDALAAQIDQTRSILVDWLGEIDVHAFAAELLATARSEVEPDYI